MSWFSRMYSSLKFGALSMRFRGASTRELLLTSRMVRFWNTVPEPQSLTHSSSDNNS